MTFITVTPWHCDFPNSPKNGDAMHFDKVQGIASWKITLQIYPLSGLSLPAQDRGWQIATTWKATPPREGVLFTLPNSIPACNRALHLQQSPLPTGSLEFVNVLVFGQVMGQWYTDPTSTMLNLRIPRGICSCRSLTKQNFASNKNPNKNWIRSRGLLQRIQYLQQSVPIQTMYPNPAVCCL